MNSSGSTKKYFMDISSKTSRVWAVSLIYAIWLNGMTYVFYAEKGVADVSLQFALVAGSIPAVLQMILCKLKIRDIIRPLIFSCVLIIIILLSFILNPTDYYMFVKVFNIGFIFFVALIIGSCLDYRIILYISSFYAVIGSAILILINYKGNYIWGRLYTEGIHANFWGEIAASVGVAAFALKRRPLVVICWAIVLVTLFNTSSRGSMVSLFAGAVVAGAVWFVEVRKKNLVLTFSAIIGCLFGLVLVLDLLPADFGKFVFQDVLRLEDEGRGLDSGMSGRAEAWSETLEIWMANPIFGVGFRQHEDLVKSASSAHNAYLAMLADTGLFGLIAYVLLISFSLWEAWRQQMPIRARIVLLAVVASYAVLGVFERRALNAGNPYSILFVICCFYSLRAGVAKRSHTVDQRLRNELKDMGQSRLSS